MSGAGPGRAGGGVTPRDDEPTTDGPLAEPVAGTAHAVREVEVLPDGRRITWYASSAPVEDGA